MKHQLMWRVVTIGLLFTLTNAHQRVAAQELSEPTVDDRFGRDTGSGQETSLLVPPQSSLAEPAEKRPAAGPAPISASQKPYLGVTFDTQVRGAMVKTVRPGSPAELAGVQPGDTIEKLQGQSIRSYEDVLDIVATMRPGELLDIECTRKLSVRVQCEIAALPPSIPQTVGYPPTSPAGSVAEHELLPTPPNSPAAAPAAAGPLLNSAAPGPPPAPGPNVRRTPNIGPGPGPIGPGFRRGFGFRRR